MLRLPLLAGLGAAAHRWQASFWGASATRVRTTPWHMDTLRRTAPRRVG
ncbi:hypothetical protein [Rubrivirga sp. SAORIC476]|nr:hypothetical protein [Rubrivirga sp. SAORIC476]